MLSPIMPGNEKKVKILERKNIFAQYAKTYDRRQMFNIFKSFFYKRDSVADPDPYVFGPHGSGSISTRTDPDPDSAIIKQN
jgi:hypothetical protein